MIIALAMCDPTASTVLGDGGTPGNPPIFAIMVRVTASDGPNSAGITLDVRIPAGTNRSHFNDIIFQAVVDWVNSQHGWTVDPRNVFLQSFDNG